MNYLKETNKTGSCCLCLEGVGGKSVQWTTVETLINGATERTSIWMCRKCNDAMFVKLNEKVMGVEESK